MSGRKFLDDIGYVDELQGLENDPGYSRLREQQETYGFDDRDTWNLNTTMVTLLYERLKMYDEVNIVDTSFHTVEHNGVVLTMQQALELMVELAEEVLTHGISEYDQALAREEEEYWELEGASDFFEEAEDGLFSLSPPAWNKQSYWFYKRRKAIEDDAFYAEKELWELWSKSFLYFWW